jgi:hypothetical protein
VYKGGRIPWIPTHSNRILTHSKSQCSQDHMTLLRCQESEDSWEQSILILLRITSHIMLTCLLFGGKKQVTAFDNAKATVANVILCTYTYPSKCFIMDAVAWHRPRILLALNRWPGPGIEPGTSKKVNLKGRDSNPGPTKTSCAQIVHEDIKIVHGSRMNKTQIVHRSRTQNTRIVNRSRT